MSQLFSPALCAVFDFGGTISSPAADPVLRGKPVDPAAIPVLHRLHARGLRLILASNTLPGQDRRTALAAAGVAGLFSAVLLSHELGASKPGCRFFAAVAGAAGCPPAQVLFTGNNLRDDVAPAIAHGMQAALIRTGGLRAGEQLPVGTLVISHVADLLTMLPPR